MGCNNCSCSGYLKTATINNIEEPLHRPIMVIGESPLPAEAANGRVMSGSSGQVLRDAMQKVGLPYTDEEIHFTNAIKCALPKKKGYKVPKEAMAACRYYLLEEVKAVRPQLILVCGATAYQTLTGRTDVKITQEYGNLQDLQLLTGNPETSSQPLVFKTIPIMNPGVLMHDSKAYKPFLAMLQLAAQTFQGKERFDAGTTAWTIIETNEEAKALYDEMQRWHSKQQETGEPSIVTFDTETTGLDYRTAQFLVMGICFELNHVWVIPREMRHVVHNFVENVPWLCHWQNGLYDKKVLWRHHVANPQIDGDSMYLHYALDETSQHDLEYLAKTYLNAEPYKYKMNQNWKAVSLESYPKFFDALCERVAVDCDYTRQVVYKLRAQLQQPGNRPLFNMYNNLLIPSANFLGRVEQNGILLDDRPLRTMDEQYAKLLIQMKEEILELAAPFWDPEQYMMDTDAKSFPMEFNPGSPAQISWMVFDRLKLRPRIKRGRSTEKEVLKSIDDPPELITKVLEYRKVAKEHSTYVIGLLDARDTDSRVRTSYTVHVTATGRLSSREPNLQNISGANSVGNIRSAFIAPAGRLLAEVDYQGAELRWLAFLSGCEVLGNVFKEGRNLHNETAKALYGEHFNAAQKLRAKAANFGIAYGREPKSFAEEYQISMAEATEMVEGWLNAYPGAKRYLQWCADQVIQGNYLQSPYGRRRRFGLVSRASIHGLKNEARNFAIQSASSDTTTTAAMMMEETLRKDFDTKIVNLVHDSILMECPADPKILQQLKTYTNEVMSVIPHDRFGCPIPFNTDFEIGKNWGEQVGFRVTGPDDNLAGIPVVYWEDKNGDIQTQPFYEWYDKVMEGYPNA